MISETFQKLGVTEWMLLLKELHTLGYQKLRWFSYMAPNGCALRCHITTQDNIFANRDICSLDDSQAFYTSTGNPRSGDDVKPLVRQLLPEMSDELLEKGKGEDADYVAWYDTILTRALGKDEFPLFNGEFYSAPLGHIIIGQDVCRTPPMKLRLVSWNIDGIKAHFDALKQLCAEYAPDIICLQKVKDSHTSQEFELPGYIRHQSNAPYAGVATYVKEYLGGETDLEFEDDLRGHVLRTVFHYPKFTLFNIYVPYSNPSVKGAVERRCQFNSYIERALCLHQDRVIACGDMNIVHTEQDCWDGKYQRNQANFHDWERESFERMLQCGGLIDTYRAMNPFAREYSYFFRNDAEVRKKNHGHRIDYFLASESLLPEITRAEIIKDITVSTNNPILLEFSY